jgi:hypothetical protein
MRRPDTYAEYAEAVSGQTNPPTYEEWIARDPGENNWNGQARTERPPDPPEPGPPADAGEGHTRRLTLTRASSITVRPVHWLWAARIALGTLALIGGREGIGKSTIGYCIAADVTRGRLPGRHFGQPRAVIVAATEDSWAHTIVPRLMAAGANLDMVYRVDVITSEGVTTGLSMPRDLHALENLISEVDAVLILLDPLVSRLDAKLDTYKDAEVRLALEPLTALADRTGAAALGLIHVNKSQTSDPLTALMASRAFAAVARAVLFVMTDPDDTDTRLLGQPKNNLGRADLPTLTFRIESTVVATTDDGDVSTGKLVWTGEREQTIHEAMEAAGETSDARSATTEAMEWLEDYLTSKGGTDDSATIKAQGHKAGHSVDALKRARKRLKAPITSHGFPRRTYWSLIGTQLEQTVGADSRSTSGESALTTPTTPTEPVSAVGAVGAVGEGPPARAREDDQPELYTRSRSSNVIPFSPPASRTPNLDQVLEWYIPWQAEQANRKGTT